jgi:hypothetical protein
MEMPIQWAWIAWSLVCLFLALGLGTVVVKTYSSVHGSGVRESMNANESDGAAGVWNVMSILTVVFCILSLVFVNKGVPWLLSVVFP